METRNEHDPLSFLQCFEPKITNGDKKYLCRASPTCEAQYTAKSSAIRHLKNNHSEKYNEIKENKIQKTGPQPDKELELRVKVNVPDILDACTELIIFNSTPLNVLNGEAFQKIIAPYVKALAVKGINLTVNAETVKKNITKKSEAIIEKIKIEAKDKYFALMIDIASRYNRSVLGVNISYILDGSIIVRTIGMHTIRMSQTAENLSVIIKENLDEFGLDVNKIIAFTTDNGKNMIKTAELFDEMQKEIHNESLATYEALLENFDSDEELDEEIFDEGYYNDLLEAIRNEFEIVSTCAQLVHGVRCGLHCLHLIIIHSINKAPNVKIFLVKVRSLVKKLRTPKYRNMMANNACNIPILDVVTRWNTIYDMVSL